MPLSDRARLLPGASESMQREHMLTVMALSLLAITWEPGLDGDGKGGRWICRACHAVTPGWALKAEDANHYDGCPVRAAQLGELAGTVGRAAARGAHGLASTWAKMIAEVVAHAVGPEPDASPRGDDETLKDLPF